MQINGQSSTPKSRGQRLRFLRKMSGLTLQKLAQKYDIGMSTIKYWECAVNEGLSAKGAKKIISAMQKEGIQCSFMWLMHGVGTLPHILDVRCASHTPPPIDDNDSSLIEEISVANEIEFFCNKIADAVTLAVFDDGMHPHYAHGDNVGGKRLYGENINSALGKHCIVETEDNQIFCRKVAPGSEPGKYNVYCVNPNTSVNPPNLYDVKLVSVAPISRVWKKM
jgi:HTH-type transcriptional regulator, cell division transcriptional repressor